MLVGSQNMTTLFLEQLFFIVVDWWRKLVLLSTSIGKLQTFFCQRSSKNTCAHCCVRIFRFENEAFFILSSYSFSLMITTRRSSVKSYEDSIKFFLKSILYFLSFFTGSYFVNKKEIKTYVLQADVQNFDLFFESITNIAFSL